MTNKSTLALLVALSLHVYLAYAHRTGCDDDGDDDDGDDDISVVTRLVKPAGCSTTHAGSNVRAGLSRGAIAGISVGSLLGLVLLIGAIFLCCRRRRQRKRFSRQNVDLAATSDAEGTSHYRAMEDVPTASRPFDAAIMHAGELYADPHSELASLPTPSNSHSAQSLSKDMQVPRVDAEDYTRMDSTATKVSPPAYTPL